MKALVLGTVTALVMLAAAGLWGTSTALADNGPHVAGNVITTDACAGCHRAHTARGAYLLKTDELSLCYTCHDGTQAATNVRGGAMVAGPANQALKGGGFISAWLNTQDPTYNGDGTVGGTTIGVRVTSQPVTSTHSVDGTAQTIWGNGALNSGVGFATFSLACTSCHDPHGNGQYRLLRKTPVADSGVVGPVDRAPAGVSVADIGTVGDNTSKAYTTGNYFNMFFGPTNISNWCTQCHSRYLASGVSSGRSSSGDSIFMYRHSANDEGASPTCEACHVSHGTNAAATGYAATVPWPNPTSAENSQTALLNNSRLLKMDNRGMCQKCHKR